MKFSIHLNRRVFIMICCQVKFGKDYSNVDSVKVGFLYCLFVCDEVLRPSQPIRVMLRAVYLTTRFPGQV